MTDDDGWTHRATEWLTRGHVQAWSTASHFMVFFRALFVYHLFRTLFSYATRSASKVS